MILLLAVIAFCVQCCVCIFNVNRQMMKKKVYFSVRRPWLRSKSKGGGDSPGASWDWALLPCVATLPPPNSPQRRSNSLSQGAKGLEVQHVQWVGTCCMQKLYCVWSSPFPSCCAGVFASCDILCVVPPPWEDMVWVRKATPGETRSAAGRPFVAFRFSRKEARRQVAVIDMHPVLLRTFFSFLKTSSNILWFRIS